MRKPAWTITALLIAVTAVLVTGQRRKQRIVRRAKPPVFRDNESSTIFFSDVFKNVNGQRPAPGSSNVPLAGNPGSATPAAGSGGPTALAGGYQWSQVISSEALENEVKAINVRVETNVTAPGPFAGRGYRLCRTDFSMVASLFAIAAEYDGDVRWKSTAPGIRDLFARTAANCKVGTTQVYNEAKLRRTDLKNLIGGGNVEANPGEAKNNWEAICDRSPLMKRLDSAMATRLQPWTSNANEFKSNLAQTKHEAQIVAALSVILQQEGMEDSGDDFYDDFCKRMYTSARQIVEACDKGDDEAARKAVGEINKACSECHENYRA